MLCHLSSTEKIGYAASDDHRSNHKQNYRLLNFVFTFTVSVFYIETTTVTTSGRWCSCSIVMSPRCSFLIGHTMTMLQLTSRVTHSPVSPYMYVFLSNRFLESAADALVPTLSSWCGLVSLSSLTHAHTGSAVRLKNS